MGENSRTLQFLAHRRNTILGTPSIDFHSARNNTAKIKRKNDLKVIPENIIWQTDGRPMSGDIGKGSTHQCVKFGSYVLKEALPSLKLTNKIESQSIEEFIQLAGGTNEHTVQKLHEGKVSFTSKVDQTITIPDFKLSKRDSKVKTSQSNYINGIAFGGYARKLVEPYFDLFQFEDRFSNEDLVTLSNCAYEIYEITAKAKQLVDKVKAL